MKATAAPRAPLTLFAAACLGLSMVVASVPHARAADAAPAAAPPPVKKVTVRSVAYFDFDKASIRPQDQATILAKVGAMKGVTWQTVTAVGHTDSVGPAVYNEKLSAERADAVKAYLVGKGLDPAMINTVAKAAAAPVAPNDTGTGRARNRRTEIEFEGVQTVAP